MLPDFEQSVKMNTEQTRDENCMNIGTVAMETAAAMETDSTETPVAAANVDDVSSISEHKNEEKRSKKGKAPKKTNKTRSDVAVQGTNDSSIVSKCSSCTIGYASDPYVKFFVAKQSRRAPLINRGYYIRAKAMELSENAFFDFFTGEKTQVVSLGGGYDAAYFRLQNEGKLQQTTYWEIDFPDLVQRKAQLIQQCEGLRQELGPQQPSAILVLDTPGYKLLGADLTQLADLSERMQKAGIDWDRPTLLLSEVVLTYIAPKKSSPVIKWAADMFPNSYFITYEQIFPADDFGRFMCKHFDSLNSSLRSINKFPSPQHQTDRYCHLGWEKCIAMDMNWFAQNLVSHEEQRRVTQLEPFDEFEEWHLKCGHYILLTAYKGRAHGVMEKLVNPIDNSEIRDSKEHAVESRTRGILVESPWKDISLAGMLTCNGDVDSVVFSTVEDVVSGGKSGSDFCRRFGHTCTLVDLHTGGSSVISEVDTYLLVLGGFGEVAGKHCRVRNVCLRRVSDTASGLATEPVRIIGGEDSVCERIYHTASQLSDGRVLVFGGRTSPTRPVQHMAIITLSEVANQNADMTASANEGAAVTNSTNEGAAVTNSTNQGAAVTNSTNQGAAVTNSTNQGAAVTNSTNEDAACEEVANEKACVSVQCHIQTMAHGDDWPEPRWRHTADVLTVAGCEVIVVYGGRRADSTVLGDCWVCNTSSLTWTQLVLETDGPGAVHSHASCTYQDSLLVTGGLDANLVIQGGLHRLDLNTRCWTQIHTQPLLSPRYSHTVAVVGKQLVLCGGVHFSNPPPGVTVVNLETNAVRNFIYQIKPADTIAMLHNHSSVILQRGQHRRIVVVGGGGNCFSFGTHLNRTLLEAELLLDDGQ